MARFVDLDDDADAPDGPPDDIIRKALRDRAIPSVETVQAAYHAAPTVLGRAFNCYPIVIGIVSSIDLNTLDALSRSNRQIHNGLIQYRSSLISSTLHCSNEDEPVNQEQLLRYRARASNWHYMEDGRSYHGKSGHCARDMVDECRRCGDVVCRNCAIKPPAPMALRERHRRLCTGCVRAPIAMLTSPPLDADLPISSDAVQHSLCKCDTKGVWLCQPCGRSIRGADAQYQSIWRWRNQYGEVLGGLGTGIGDGDRGVVCGRDEECLAARDREHEIDCDAEDARDGGTAPWTAELPVWTTTSTPSPPALEAAAASPAGSPFGPETPIGQLIDEHRHESTPSPQLGPGYERHEIEGIGGRVKRKLVRMVRVGACVPEWDDEKGMGSRVLASEVIGKRRSWCGWCWRVIPGQKDLDGVHRNSWTH